MTILANITATQVQLLIEGILGIYWQSNAPQLQQKLSQVERARYAEQVLRLLGAIVYHKDANGNFERLVLPSTGSQSAARGSVRMTGTPGTLVPRAMLLGFSPVNNLLNLWWMDADATIGADGTAVVPITFAANGTVGNCVTGLQMIPIPAVTGLDPVATVLAPGITGGH